MKKNLSIFSILFLFLFSTCEKKNDVIVIGHRGAMGHALENTIERLRKKPRQTTTNKNHLEAVWGNDGCTNIFIPTLVDDYNHWMGGVDMTDQLIAYYHPNIRCFRTWIPMFIQILSMIRTNSYIIYKSFHSKSNQCHLNHK